MSSCFDNKKRSDDFWDLARIIEKKQINEPKEAPACVEPPITAKKTESVTLSPIEDNYKAPTLQNTYTSAKISPRATYEQAEEYEASTDKPLILKVALSRVSGGASRSFSVNAAKYWARDGQEVPFVDFYAYLPTYANFTRETWDYYLWWRTNFRQGSCIKVSWSYISIYVSELINCPELISKQDSLLELWRIFDSYGNSSSPMFVNDVLHKLPEIICDYMIINSLSIPDDVSDDTVMRAVSIARLKEIFFEDTRWELFIKLLLASCSVYDYKKGKFASEIINDKAEKYIIGAISECIATARSSKIDHPFAGSIREVTTLSRHSYSNYVHVSAENNYLITVDICSLNRSYTLRNSITGIVKQCENCIRAHYGIKARLKIFSLEPVFRDLVDAFFETHLPPDKGKKAEQRKRKNEVLPEYEKYYEADNTHDFSIERARGIEEKSWNTVKMLVENPVEDEPVEIPTPKTEEIAVAQPVSEPADVESDLEAIMSFCGENARFLWLIHEGRVPEALQLSRERGVPAEVIADEINAASFDVIGDAIIERTDRGFSIISDYEYIFDGAEMPDRGGNNG